MIRQRRHSLRREVRYHSEQPQGAEREHLYVMAPPESSLPAMAPPVKELVAEQPVVAEVRRAVSLRAVLQPESVAVWAAEWVAVARLVARQVAASAEPESGWA